MAISFVVRDTVQSILQNLSEMTPEQREAWRREQFRKKAEHDAWLAQHLEGEQP